MPLLESYVSDGTHHKLEISTLYPLTSGTMHMLQNGTMVSRGAKQEGGGVQPPPPLNFLMGGGEGLNTCQPP